MATINGYTAEYMETLKNQMLIDGYVDGAGDLWLEPISGAPINAGHVKGADGSNGSNATALLGVTDGTTVDLGLTGAGTVASPWNLTAEVKALPTGAIVKGVLEATYRGGAAKVKIAGVLSSTTYSWMSPYVPGGSREVNLMKVGTGFVILGQNNDSYVPLDLDTTYIRMYNYSLGNSLYGTLARAQKSSAGIVSLSGLLRMVGTPAANTTLATLPSGYRPDKDLLLPILGSNSAAVLRIKSNGQIQNYSAFVANAYVTLDGLSWPAAGVATWTDVGNSGSSFGANFETTSSWITTYGAPGYWLDPYGFVWFRGIVRPKVTTSADGTVIFNLPAGYVADAPQHIRACGEGAFAHVQFATTGLLWKSNSPGTIGEWISVSGVVGVTSAGRSGNPWMTPGILLNGWVDYGGAYPVVQYVRREDGMCFTGGLIKSGTPPTNMFLMSEEEYWPTRGRLILTTTSNATAGRLDIDSAREQDLAGIVNANIGVTNWFSLDGKNWIP